METLLFAKQFCEETAASSLPAVSVIRFAAVAFFA